MLSISGQPHTNLMPKHMIMGLDMFAFRVRVDADRQMPDVDARFTDEGKLHDEQGNPLFEMLDSDFYYWRNHPDLHGWMHQLYRAKGGEDPSFNCNSVRLTSEDLDTLEAAIKGSVLPRTSGFFFGESRPDNRAGDLEFIAKAREAIAAGDAVYYDSWW